MTLTDFRAGGKLPNHAKAERWPRVCARQVTNVPLPFRPGTLIVTRKLRVRRLSHEEPEDGEVFPSPRGSASVTVRIGASKNRGRSVGAVLTGQSGLATGRTLVNKVT